MYNGWQDTLIEPNYMGEHHNINPVNFVFIWQNVSLYVNHPSLKFKRNRIFLFLTIFANEKIRLLK